MLNKFLNVLFPELCPICQRPSSDHKIAPICTECWQTIQQYEGPKCRKCGRPLVSDVSITCGDCLKDEPAFIRARSFGIYDGALKKAINLFKYHNVKRLSSPLSGIMLRKMMPRVETVVPVPLYGKRLRQRGFNQSALIAGHMASHIGAEPMIGNLVKVRDTMPQVGLSSAERRKNIRNAFEIRNREQVRNKSILLVDDVITTGATAGECSRVLKETGAQEVYVMALAHGVMD
jgi:ComF family protein